MREGSECDAPHSKTNTERSRAVADKPNRTNTMNALTNRFMDDPNHIFLLKLGRVPATKMYSMVKARRSRGLGVNLRGWESDSFPD